MVGYIPSPLDLENLNPARRERLPWDQDVGRMSGPTDGDDRWVLEQEERVRNLVRLPGSK